MLHEVGRGEIRPARLLATDPTGSLTKVEGDVVREPTFELPAIGIAKTQRDEAEVLGYTAVNAPTVIATHLTELLRRIAADLMGRSEAQELLNIFARREPRLVDELIPNVLGLGEVIQVFKRLLAEGVSIRDLRTILEALADHGEQTKDVSREIELRDALERHAVLLPSLLALTKLDEALEPDAALSACVLSGLPLAWMTTGLRVPEDLLAATPERLATALCGEETYR